MSTVFLSASGRDLLIAKALQADPPNAFLCSRRAELIQRERHKVEDQ